MKAKKPGDRWPDPKTLKRIRDELSDPNYDGGNLALPSDASELDRAKYELCQIIARYRHEHDLMQKDIAAKLAVDEARISQILRGRIESFTLDRLIGYAEKLHPGLKVRISAA